MIGKIMTEASHSIIGMLSAKPLDMETGTENNAFNTLLTSGENRRDAALHRDETESLGETNGDGFLEQLIGTDHSSPSASDPSKPSINKMAVNADDGFDQDSASAAPTDIGSFVSKMSSPMRTVDRSHSDSPSVSTGSFNPANASNANGARAEIFTSSQQQPLAAANSGNRPSPIAPDEASPSQNAQLNIGNVAKIPMPPTMTPTDDRLASRDSAAQPETPREGRKAIALVSLPSRPAAEARESHDENSKELNAAKLSDHAKVQSRSPEAMKMALQNHPLNPTSSATGNGGKETAMPSKNHSGGSEKKPLPATDIEIHARSIIDVLRGKTPIAASTVTATGNTGPGLEKSDIKPITMEKLAPKKGSGGQELKTPISTVAIEKPMATDWKSFVVEGKNGPVDLGLRDQVDLPTANAAGATLAALGSTQKPVSFDGNAPQFAERFASEIGDLKINGDLKKFELNPRNLGRLEVSFVMRGGTEMLLIEADNEAAREMIIQHGQAIQDLLKSQGRTDLGLRIDLRDNALAGGHDETTASDQQDNDAADNRDAEQTVLQSHAQPLESEGSVSEARDTSRYA